MSEWVPPYFGSYEQLVAALLNDPFLGSPHSNNPKHDASAEHELNPQPLPPSPDPFRNAAVRYLAGLVSMQELARATDNEQLRNELNAGAEAGIQAFMDDFCGTPPRRIPWNWPGPPPWVSVLAAQVVSAANTQTGTMREGLLQVAGRIAAAGRAGLRASGAAGAAG
jgi:hypothetical protein